MRELGNVPRSQGGCWFCLNKDEDMEFTCEWDANFHMDCLHEALKDPNNEEAKIIAREFGVQVKDEIYFAKLREDAIIPSKRDEDGGFDIYAFLEDGYLVLDPHETVMLSTGIISAFSKKYRIVLAERGSTGTKGIGQRAGVFDSGFRGEWKVPFTNHNSCPLVLYRDGFEYICNEVCLEFGRVKKYPISKAICQALVEEVPQVTPVEKTVEEVLAMVSERGEGMLGSSLK